MKIKTQVAIGPEAPRPKPASKHMHIYIQRFLELRAVCAAAKAMQAINAADWPDCPGRPHAHEGALLLWRTEVTK